MKLDLSDKRAIVTGGARGIGRAISDALANAGAEVHAIDMNTPDDTGNIAFHQADITNISTVAQVVDEIGEPISILVNNAGITRDRTLMKMSDEEWNTVININLTGSFNMLRAVAPLMAAGKGGAIINITSINGIRGKIGQGNYAASKAGLIGLTKSAARELGRKGITVNAVAPGMVMTEMARALPQEILDRALAETALNQLAEPADIANAVVFLASSAARFITGQVLQVDSGQLI
ncbi:3-oxoacyl-[acyl-carrier protein] reductase [hydrothermal vent metagenome]|uniref:3-oxoacyl-[acyl-carrier protein] reductase n=1 Tax=hydrothermal vent metagenome TaxID=652676 RepID=A0A3B0R9L1_9ZZZZ